MQLEVFKKSICMACGRPSEELGYCPWCGAGMRVRRLTLLRLASVLLAAALLFFNTLIPHSSVFVAVAAVVSAILVAASAPDSNNLLSATAAAVAGSALCLAFPETAAEIGSKLRLHTSWIPPAASVVFICSGGATLPPVPSASPWGRLGQALKTPIAVMGLASLVAVTAGLPTSPATSVSMALCCFAAFQSAKARPLLHAAVVLFFSIAFLGSDGGPLPDAVHPRTVFAVAIAVLGLAQAFIGMNRTASDPSIHP